MEKVENYCTGYKQSKMQIEPVGLLEKKSRAQVKQGKAKHHIQEIPRFPTVSTMESNKLPMPLGYFQWY